MMMLMTILVMTHGMNITIALICVSIVASFAKHYAEHSADLSSL